MAGDALVWTNVQTGKPYHHGVVLWDGNMLRGGEWSSVPDIAGMSAINDAILSLSPHRADGEGTPCTVAALDRASSKDEDDDKDGDALRTALTAPVTLSSVPPLRQQTPQ